MLQNVLAVTRQWEEPSQQGRGAALCSSKLLVLGPSSCSFPDAVALTPKILPTHFFLLLGLEAAGTFHTVVKLLLGMPTYHTEVPRLSLGYSISISASC